MRRIATLLALALTLGATGAVAQAAWPAKPVKFFVAGAAGSAPDIIARVLGDQLGQVWGQTVVIDNRPGAAGNIGTLAAIQAGADDGHNILFGQAAPLAMNQHLFKEMPFDATKDLSPIVAIGLSPMMIAVNVDLPVNTVPELIALAKAKPGSISFGTSSSRNIPHLTGEMLANMAGIKMLHVAYRAGGQAAQDAIAGRIQIYIDGVPPMTAHMESKKLRVIATSAATRLPNFPDVPAVAETLPGFSMQGWFALMAVAGTPQAVVTKINADVNAMVKKPEVAARLRGFGMYGPGGSIADLAAFLATERANYAKAVTAAGLARE